MERWSSYWNKTLLNPEKSMTAAAHWCYCYVYIMSLNWDNIGIIVVLNHLPLVPHIYSSVNWAIIGSGNGLSPVRHQAITWTNAGLLSIGLLGTSFSEIWIQILSFSFKKMHLKMLSATMAAILSRGRGVKSLMSPWRPLLSQHPMMLSSHCS